MAAESDRQCSGCAAYVKHPQQIGIGKCMLNPPTPIVTAQGILPMHAMVNASDYCMQWRTAAPAAEAPSALEVVK